MSFQLPVVSSLATGQQMIQVVQCVNCKFFQSQIAKKSNKWTCKICSSKQTLLKVFSEGSGADCRKVIQQLNKARVELEEIETASLAVLNQLKSPENSTSTTSKNNSFAFENSQSFNLEKEQKNHKLLNTKTTSSKWSKYLEGDSD